MTFPDKKFPDAIDFVSAYGEQIASAWASIDSSAVARAAALVLDALVDDRAVFACGNGGSAAISNHLLCDFSKGIQTDTDLKPRVISLSNNIEIITAIANDIAYEEIFVHQLRIQARPGDVLIATSSSGMSENIVRAVTWARDNRLRTISLTGFSGGQMASLADVNVHVGADNYGVIEDVHQSIMHIMAQYIRQSRMESDNIAQQKF